MVYVQVNNRNKYLVRVGFLDERYIYGEGFLLSIDGFFLDKNNDEYGEIIRMYRDNATKMDIWPERKRMLQSSPFYEMQVSYELRNPIVIKRIDIMTIQKTYCWE